MVAFDAESGAQPHERVFANQISEGLRRSKYMLIDRPSVNPFVFTTASQVPALPSASQGQVNTIIVPGAFGLNAIEMFQSTAQSKFPARSADVGLEIGLDLVNNESVEYVPGGNDALNPLAYVRGTDPGVLHRLTLAFADVSGTDQFFVGFRKLEAYQVPTSVLSAGDGLYTDFIGIGFSGAANPNDVKIVSDLNNSGSTTVHDTGFNWADGLYHKLEVHVAAGKVRFFINGVELGGTVSKDALGNAITAQATIARALFTFDDGDTLIPVVFHRYDSATPGAVIARRWEVGQLLEVGLQSSGRGPQAAS